MRITVRKGDIQWQRFVINTFEGVHSTINFTNIYFTVKKTSMDKVYLFQKSLKRDEIYRLGPGDYQLKIDDKDMEHMSVGEYKFDIQISYKNLLKETFVGDFIVKEEVTHITNEDEDDGEAGFSLPSEDEQGYYILEVPDYHEIELTTPVQVTAYEGSTYEDLPDKPKINHITLRGDVSLQKLGIQPIITTDENGYILDLSPASQVDWESVQHTPTTLNEYGITDAATKDELQDILDRVAKVYKYKGTVPTAADLDDIVDPENGDVYDVESDGANYVWNATEERWDCLGGVFRAQALSRADIDAVTQ